MATTIEKINEALKTNNYDVEIVKGDGYFYFMGLDGSPFALDDAIPSVMVHRIKDLGGVFEVLKHVREHYPTIVKTKEPLRSSVLRTAVAEYGDTMPGVLEVSVITGSTTDDFASISTQDSEGSVIIGSADQARQLISALNAVIEKLWSE